MYKVRKSEKGITLVSLIVTIIMLLILSGISILMLTGENGILKTSKKAKTESQKAEYKEAIQLAKTEDNITKERDRSKTERLDGIYEIISENSKFSNDIKNGKTTIEKIYDDGLEPRIIIITKEGWKYTVTVDEIIEGDIPPIDLENANIKIQVTPSYWTNKDVEVTIEVQNEKYKEYKIQYSFDAETWTDYNSSDIIKVSENKTISVRLINGMLVSEIASTEINNIDKELPVIDILGGDVTSSKTCELTVNASDTKSGLKKYEIYVNGDVVATNSNYTITDMEFNKIYTCYAIATDNAGNSKQSSTITLKNEAYVATLTDLSNFRDSVNQGNSYSGKTITQISDINLQCNSSNQWIPIGNSSITFSGTYDGNKKKISGIYINNTDIEQSLFGRINGNLKNVIMSDGYIKCGSVNGGIVAVNYGTVSNCYNNCNITIILNSGGNGNGHSGGIVGLNYGSVTGCCNNGSINVENGNYSTAAIGGIVGYGRGAITNCYNRGLLDVSNVNSYMVGGILSEILSSGKNIENCYNIGNINYTNSNTGLGGICYDNSNASAKIINCYYINTCGAAGDGISKASSELKKLATTLGNAFKNDGGNINEGYPILSWQ